MGQLHQSQVKKVDALLDTEKGRPTPLKQLNDAEKGVSDMASSGGNGGVLNDISKHDSGSGKGPTPCYRLQYGLANGEPTSDLRVSFTVPKHIGFL